MFRVTLGLAAAFSFCALAACSSTKENAFDVETECRAACTAPSGTPCAGQTAPPTCFEDCMKLATAHTGSCQQCLARTSGFRWTSCECKTCDFGHDPLCVADPNGCKVCRAGRNESACHSDSQCREPAGCTGFALASATPVDPDAGAPVPHDCTDSCR